jgi:two-component system, NarL family, nitrate/nitrite response regulator NarL
MVMRCLIVDDSAVFLRAARALLERTGMAVVVASTGAEARRVIDEVGPDVVLVDIDLGEENGFDVAAELCARTGDGDRPPRIILISSHSQEDFEELITASPARGFLSKSLLSAAAIRAMADG